MKYNPKTRLSSYQKIKKQNRELKNDIAILVEKSDTIEGLEVKSRWVFRLQTERMIMAGMRFGSSSDLQDGKVRPRTYQRGSEWLP